MPTVPFASPKAQAAAQAPDPTFMAIAASDVVKEAREAPFDPEGSGYDMKTALRAGLGPDETGHWPSRDPESGQILKGRGHKTFYLTEEGEAKAGYKIRKGDDGRYYSQKED